MLSDFFISISCSAQMRVKCQTEIAEHARACLSPRCSTRYLHAMAQLSPPTMLPPRPHEPHDTLGKLETPGVWPTGAEASVNPRARQSCRGKREPGGHDTRRWSKSGWASSRKLGKSPGHDAVVSQNEACLQAERTFSALYPRYRVTAPKVNRCFSAFCTNKPGGCCQRWQQYRTAHFASIDVPATMPIVVGRDAAHTPSRLSVRSSIPEATTSGGAHSKHAVSPGTSS